MAKKAAPKKETKPAEGSGAGPAAAQQNGGQNGAQTAPSLSVLTQYIKDFSFENPNSPNSLLPREKQPEINININVHANPMSETDFEVVLQLDAKAGQGKDMMFNVSLAYAGVFRLANIPNESMHAAVLIECPRLLFPFARHIISDATRNGGFQPLMIDPVDFARLYHARMSQAAAQQQAEQGAKGQS